QIIRKENDYEAMKALRKFCDANNGFLRIKSRQKDPVKKYAAKMADKVLYDQEFYPSTVLKCFAVADIFFSFYSTGVMEAAIARVSSVCIAPAEQDWSDIQGAQFKDLSQRGLFDWPGVSYLQTIPEIISGLAQKRISDFAFLAQEQAKYLQRFADGKIHGVAESIVLEIEKILQKE
ncbi:MAG: hypothetical protein PHE77_02525, partial [Candidatus Pacebacteria bacterium]|nr:hypothetical protein [Candidatus Paceibacterota bacterium]